MSDSDTYAIEDPQTRVLLAFAAYETFQSLAQQATTQSRDFYQERAAWWLNEAKNRGAKWGMKQRQINRGY